MKKLPIVTIGTLSALIPSLYADNVILDDLIVSGSAAIGLDAVNGESFGFDTLKLKENNLRIKFDDTSVSASFPSVDWQLTANDTSNGGANKFSIDDITNGRTPFTIEASAPSNSLFVDDGGRVGLGTAAPVVELHVASGDSPTLRLEQNGSSGFTAQTWDVAGNETNFFVRDVNNGSALPFKIRPNSGSDLLTLNSTGVGVGVANATNQFHVRESAAAVPALIEGTNANPTTTVLQLKNNGETALALTTADGDWFMKAIDGETLTFIGGEGDAVLDLTSEGELRVLGTVEADSMSVVSDVNRKHAIEAVDPRGVLKKVVEMPISEWSYKKDEAAEVRHIGPMAQDFEAQFGLGKTNTRVNVVDTAGVALAAIQGLNDVVEEKNQQIEHLQKRSEKLEAQLEVLAEQIQKLTLAGKEASQ